ncbi:MAG: type I-U CRISPR-associated helicase/endonuclease Cas3 [Tepidisphaeraceae bacterium]
MSSLSVTDFKKFFAAIHKFEPFRWQCLLLERVMEQDWPNLIDLPTASGKTACIDVSIFALAAGVKTPRRTWFVVDRRIVVDEAFERAKKIAVALKYAVASKAQQKEIAKDADLAAVLAEVADPAADILKQVGQSLLALGGSQQTPLEVARLRGGVPRDVAWAGNPAQPAVLTSTIDQVGSRLLFRGYGIGQNAQPVHAALAGNDSLIVLDEAHLAAPFLQTVQAIEKFRDKPWAEKSALTPFKLVVMSATPPPGMNNPERFPEDHERADALNHPLLQQRMAALKPTVLAEAKTPKAAKGKSVAAVCDDELVLDAAARAAGYVAKGRRRVGVMVNRVATAQLIHKQLAESQIDAEIKLLTGRLRPLDRDALLAELTPKLRSGSREELLKPIILVTTQCLEVGADFSFEALISECASLDALRQRFGRLARLGTPADAEGTILIRKKDARPESKIDDEKPLDPIYHNAAARTWNWLTADGATSIDMGIDALSPRLKALDAEAMAKLLGPQLRAPTLLPAYLDLWSQTTDPRPAIEPDIPLFLHGVPPADEKPRVTVQVLWRNDLDLAAKDEDWADLIANLPPLPGELLQVPLRLLESLLGTYEKDAAVDADLEGLTESPPDERRKPQKQTASEAFVLWRGRKDCGRIESFSELRTDDIVVFPASSKTFEALLPEVSRSDNPRPADVDDAAYQLKHGAMRERFRTVDGKGQPTELDEDAERELRADRKDVNGNPIFNRAIIGSYGNGFYHITQRVRPQPVDAWESDEDEDAGLYDTATPDRLSLDAHTRAVRKAVDAMLNRIPALGDLAAVLQRAADLHDIGKADSRFQFILSGGRRGGTTLLAKSKTSDRPTRQQTQRLYELSLLPKGFRHELLSSQMADLLCRPKDQESTRDLELHLIGAHHGQCRPFARVVLDELPPATTCPSAYGEIAITPAQRSERPPHRLDSGVAERFWTLTRHYGWWGLAYLEAILRCADTHASKFAEEGGSR